MKKLISTNSLKRNKVILLSFFFLALVLLNSSMNPYYNVTSYTEQEAYDAIIEAFVIIEQASKEGIDVNDFVDRLNSALNHYENNDYDEAYSEASQIAEELQEILTRARWNLIAPYVLLPINLVLIAAIVVFFGRNIRGWFRKKRDEEFLDLEFVYEERETQNNVTTDSEVEK